jgi:hypothetical protein
MLVRPIKLRARRSCDEFATNLLDISNYESAASRPRFDMAAELIAKCQRLRRQANLKQPEQLQSAAKLRLMHSSEHAHISSNFTQLTREGPSLPGFRVPMLITVTRRLIKADTQAPELAVANAAESLDLQPSMSHQVKQPLVPNGIKTHSDNSSQALAHIPRSPKSRRPQSSKQYRPENLHRHRSVIKPAGSTQEFSRRLSVESRDLSGTASRIFDVGRVFRVTSGVYS